MLSPDPVTQAPENGQNYNRYTYAFNNPLRYTDPSGYESEPVCGGISEIDCDDLFGDSGSILEQGSFPSKSEIDSLDRLWDFLMGDFDHLRDSDSGSSD